MTGSSDRRELSFNSLADAVAEVERLASGEVRTTGNHSFGQIIEHLALSLDVGAGRLTAPKPPFFMKLMMPLIRRMVLNDKPLEPGVKLPAQGEAFFWPDKEFNVSEALDHLKDSVSHYQKHGPLEKHPFFGNLTREQSEDLNIRHAALHLSFVHPA